MTTFEEFVKAWNAKLDAQESHYYSMWNGLTPHDEPCDEEFEGPFACDLLYDESDYEVLVNNIINVDSDKSITEREIVFEAEGNNYFIGIVQTCDDYLVTKIYPVTSIEEITTYEYTIKTEHSIIKVQE